MTTKRCGMRMVGARGSWTARSGASAWGAALLALASFGCSEHDVTELCVSPACAGDDGSGADDTNGSAVHELLPDAGNAGATSTPPGEQGAGGSGAEGTAGSAGAAGGLDGDAGATGPGTTPVPLAITSPLDHAVLNAKTPDCDRTADAGTSAGLHVTVTGTSTAVDGSAVTLAIGTGAPRTTSVSHGAFSACVAAPDGLDQTLGAVVTDANGQSEGASIHVDVDTLPPTDPIVAPSFNVLSRRPGRVQVSWTAVGDTGGTLLAAYRLRCAFNDITDETGWSAAAEVPLTTRPAAAGSAESEQLSLKTGFDKHCVVRGEDAGGQLTPLRSGLSTEIANPFIETEYDSVPNYASVRFGIAPVGDVDGDGYADFIVGAEDLGAQLFFGGPTPGTKPSVTISGFGGGRFGMVVAGLGDINGDGRPDFAIGAPTAVNGGLTAAGSVYVFFGRRAGDTWPQTLSVQPSPGCGADLCFHATEAQSALGSAISATDFDGDGVLDLVIGAKLETSQGISSVGRVYVIRGGTQLAANSSFNLPDSNPNGFVIDPPNTTTRVFGASLAALAKDADGKGQLVIGAVGSGGVPGAVFLVAGQAYPSGSSGLVAPALTLSPFATGTSTDFGAPVVALGDFNGDGFDDVGVGRDYLVGGTCDVYLGQAGGFAGASQRLVYNNDLADNDWSTFAATSFHPAFGLIGDLDGDGLGELGLGSLFEPPPITANGTAEIFYGGAGAISRPRSHADARFQSAGQGNLGINFVGDIDGDGFNDVALFDTDAGGASRVTLLH